MSTNRSVKWTAIWILVGLVVTQSPAWAINVGQRHKLPGGTARYWAQRHAQNRVERPQASRPIAEKPRVVAISVGQSHKLPAGRARYWAQRHAQNRAEGQQASRAVVERKWDATNKRCPLTGHASTVSASTVTQDPTRTLGNEWVAFCCDPCLIVWDGLTESDRIEKLQSVQREKLQKKSRWWFRGS